MVYHPDLRISDGRFESCLQRCGPVALANDAVLMSNHRRTSYNDPL